MKSTLKIIVPILFAGAIMAFVGYKSGWFEDTTKPAVEEKTTPEQEAPKAKESIKETSNEKVETTVAEPAKSAPQKPPVKKQPVDTQQQVEMKPVIMPGSKSGIMIQPDQSRKKK